MEMSNIADEDGRQGFSNTGGRNQCNDSIRCIKIGVIFLWIIYGGVDVIVAVVLSGIAVVLIAINLGVNTLSSDSEDKARSASTQSAAEDMIRVQFPGYFRTAEEHEEILRLHKALVIKDVNITDHDVPEIGFYLNTSVCSASQNVTCSNWRPPTKWSDIQFNNVYHACCYSYNTYKSPDYMKDINGKIRKMAQFDGNKQYFLQEICTQVPACNIPCQCKQQTAYVSGVYDDGSNGYGISTFQMPGCCKCVNNA